MSQEEAASIIGVSRSAVQSWEIGRRTPPRRTLERIRRVIRGTTTRYRTDYLESSRVQPQLVEIGRTAAIEHIDQASGRVLLRITYVIEASPPIRIDVRREEQPPSSLP